MNTRDQYMITSMNIELTTKCPLRCPQCYCSLEGGKDIPLQIAVEYLKQAKAIGIQHVELSGGETLCYPHLYELISEAESLGIESNIAISGWGFNAETLNMLQKAGLSHIFVSLNAPTKELNKITRDGYEYAVSALKILRDSSFSEVYINWVMHRETAGYLPEMIELAKKYKVKAIVIMTPKPTSKHELHTLPTREQMQKVIELLRSESGKYLRVESCFSSLLAMAGQTKLLGNLNIGPYNGCGAGRFMLSVNVDGALSPCRHLECYENWAQIKDYWTRSSILETIRTLEDKKEEPCLSCEYEKYCRHCLAINDKLNKRLFFGNELCPIPNQ